MLQKCDFPNGKLYFFDTNVVFTMQVFVRAVHEAKWMSEMEISIYDSWFNPVVSELPGLVPDAFIYLRASPDTCMQRLHSRKRYSLMHVIFLLLNLSSWCHVLQ